MSSDQMHRAFPSIPSGNRLEDYPQLLMDLLSRGQTLYKRLYYALHLLPYRLIASASFRNEGFIANAISH